MNIATDYIILILFFLCFFNLKIAGKNSFWNDYLSYNESLSLRGIFALIIVLHHLATGIEIHSSVSLVYRIFLYAGPWAVMMFFFLTGYGVQNRWINDKNYVNSFIKNRFKSIIPLYLIALAIYIIITILIGKPFEFY